MSGGPLVERIEVAPIGRTKAVVDPLSFRTSFTFDAAGREIQRKDAEGNITTSVYDLAGRQIAVVNAEGHRTSMVYNALGWRWSTPTPIARRSPTMQRGGSWCG